MENVLLQLPEGYRFVPTDEELIKEYLMKKVDRQPIPFNPIHVVPLYSKNPQDLAENYTASNGKWYFFTQRNRKYKNGNRTNREAGDGTWKAVNKDELIRDDNGQLLGNRKSLAFHVGKKKTAWLMHEYTLPSPKLNDWVLCKIYKSNRKTNDEDVGQEKLMSGIRSPINEEQVEAGAHETPQLDHMIVPSTTVNKYSYYPMENLQSTGLMHMNGSVRCSLFNHGGLTYIHLPHSDSHQTTATTTTLDPILTVASCLSSFDSYDNYVSMSTNGEVTTTTDTGFADVSYPIMAQTTLSRQRPCDDYSSYEPKNNSKRPTLLQQEDQENLQGHVNQNNVNIGQYLNLPYLPDQASLPYEVPADTGFAAAFNPNMTLKYASPCNFQYNSPGRIVAHTTKLSREHPSDDHSIDHYELNNNSKRPRLPKEVEKNRPSHDSSDERNNSKRPRLQKDEENCQGHVNQDNANDVRDFAQYLNQILTDEASDELNNSKQPSEERNNSKQPRLQEDEENSQGGSQDKANDGAEYVQFLSKILTSD